MVDPRAHRCTEQTIDYSAVNEGRLHCTVCGRRWSRSAMGWEPTPLTKHPPPVRG